MLAEDIINMFRDGKKCMEDDHPADKHICLLFILKVNDVCWQAEPSTDDGLKAPMPDVRSTFGLVSALRYSYRSQVLSARLALGLLLQDSCFPGAQLSPCCRQRAACHRPRTCHWQPALSWSFGYCSPQF